MIRKTVFLLLLICFVGSMGLYAADSVDALSYEQRQAYFRDALSIQTVDRTEIYMITAIGVDMPPHGLRATQPQIGILMKGLSRSVRSISMSLQDSMILPQQRLKLRSSIIRWQLQAGAFWVLVC